MKFRLVLVAAYAMCTLGAIAGPYGDLANRLSKLPADKVKSEVDNSGLISADQQDEIASRGETTEPTAQALRDYVTIRAKLEKGDPSATSTPIREIKKSGLYRKADPSSGENWLGRAINRLRFKLPEGQASRAPSVPSLPVIPFLVYVMWGILGAAVITFAFFAARYFILQKRESANRQSKAMLEDDEPERSLDEWLEMAAKLEAEGRYREAVRCLYVACLLKVDEHRVARFDRTQTNWEHYRRIMAAHKFPSQFDLLGPTQEFDRIWYGNHSTSAVDVKRFRESYTELGQLLASQAGASR